MSYPLMYRECLDPRCDQCRGLSPRPDPMPGAGPAIVRATTAIPAPAPADSRRIWSTARKAELRKAYEETPAAVNGRAFFGAVGAKVDVGYAAAELACRRLLGLKAKLTVQRGDARWTVSCGTCGQAGHTAKTCERRKVAG